MASRRVGREGRGGGGGGGQCGVGQEKRAGGRGWVEEEEGLSGASAVDAERDRATPALKHEETAGVRQPTRIERSRRKGRRAGDKLTIFRNTRKRSSNLE